MKFTILLIAALSLFSYKSVAQQRIDSSFAFQSNPAKKYSLYIPSTYDQSTPNKLMVGFHPFNVNRWWAESWCDTLIQFAETNGLILMCPDGDSDGRVDDANDTAFTSALLDSVMSWYSIDDEKVYAMGFSVGGRATYTYGLHHPDIFGGFIPIGAAINGTNDVNSVIHESEGKPYYLVHGGSDSPNIRYTPILNALNDNDAIVNSILMPGVGHTIDFPDRNQILTDAFIWIDSVNCAAPIDTTDTTVNDTTTGIQSATFTTSRQTIYPIPQSSDHPLSVEIISAETGIIGYRIYDSLGRIQIQSRFRKSQETERINLSISNLNPGVYFLRIDSGDPTRAKFIVQ
jgi:predicted esterase